MKSDYQAYVPLQGHPRLKATVSGVRGIVGETMTPELALRLGRAFAQFVGGCGKTVAVCRDSRPSGPMVLSSVVAGLTSMGVNVIDLGIVPVPTIEFYVKDEELDGGIDVTASHNPVEWNALKFIGEGGYFLGPDEIERLFKAYETGDFETVDVGCIGSVSEDPKAVEKHIARILSVVDVELIKKARFKVACDCCNASAYRATPLLLKELGCEIVPLYTDPTQPFPHVAEPKPEYITDLCAAVKEQKCDLGTVQDPDADRLVFVDETGTALSEELTLVLAAKTVLDKSPGKPVVVNLSTSRMIEDVAAEYGSKVERAKIGEINVSIRMREIGAAFGGEGNGGVMLPGVHECRDSLTGIALVLQLMAESKKKISQISATIPRYAMVKEKYDLSQPEKLPAMLEALKAMAKDGEVDTRDGVKIAWKDRWLHVRGSNTEPIMRVMTEAPGEKEARELAQRAAGTMGL